MALPFVFMKGQADLPEVIAAGGEPRRFAPYCTAGSKMAINTPMMAIDTNNSTNVKPRRLRRHWRMTGLFKERTKNNFPVLLALT